MESTLSFFISTRFMPVAAVVLPIYMILKNLGGLDNIWVLAIVYMSINLAITVWMMRSFFLEVPFEIVEAARVDGAGSVPRDRAGRAARSCSPESRQPR